MTKTIYKSAFPYINPCLSSNEITCIAVLVERLKALRLQILVTM